MRRLCLVLLAVATPLAAQPADPNDPEGIAIWPNKQGRFAWKRKGFWKITPLHPPGRLAHHIVATPVELKAMNSTLESLTATLRATPQATALTGFYVLDSRTYEAKDKQLDRVPAAFQFTARYFPFYTSDILVNGQFVPEKGGETESVAFEFNRLPGSFKQPVRVFEPPPPAGGDNINFFFRPQITGQFKGLPVYDDTDIVIARPGRDPWMPAPYGRVLRAAMPGFEKDRASAEQRLASLKQTNETTQAPAYEQTMRERFEKNYGALKEKTPQRYQTRLASLEQELQYNRKLAAARANPQRGDKDGAWYWNPIDAHAEAARRLAAMTPADAAKPACFADATGLAKEGRYAVLGMVGIAGADSADCKALVTENVAYFDAKLPRSAPQLLWVNSLGRCARVVNGELVGHSKPRVDIPPHGCLQHVPIWREMDWSQVAALLVP